MNYLQFQKIQKHRTGSLYHVFVFILKIMDPADACSNLPIGADIARLELSQLKSETQNQWEMLKQGGKVAKVRFCVVCFFCFSTGAFP